MKRSVFPITHKHRVMVCAVLAAAVAVMFSLSACGLPFAANYSDGKEPDAVSSAEDYAHSGGSCTLRDNEASDVSADSGPISENTDLKITKHPVSETVSPGNGEWFIARAENSTGIIWEFLDTYENVYSPSDLQSLFSGLYISFPDSDTISIDNIPMDMYGWSVRAVFEGTGGPLETDRAYIYVVDPADPYSCILQKYATAFKYGSPSAEYCKSNDISMKAAECGNPGYALVDIDENEVYELLIACTENSLSGYESRLLLDVYTVVDEAPYSLCSSTGSSLFYLLDDGRILTETFSTVFRTSGVYHLTGDFLLYDEVYSAQWEPDSPDDITWVHKIDSSIGYSDETPISSAEAENALYELHSRTVLPELTAIS